MGDNECRTCLIGGKRLSCTFLCVRHGNHIKAVGIRIHLDELTAHAALISIADDQRHMVDDILLIDHAEEDCEQQGDADENECQREASCR